MSVITMLNREDAPDKAIVGVVLYGNPYWAAPGSGHTSAGTATRGRGTFVATGKVVPEKYHSRTKDYCNDNDIFCSGGYSLPVHLAYPITPQGKASIDFSIESLKKAGL